MANDIVELRTGQFSSVFLTLNSSSLTVIKRALAKKVKKSPSFFQNVPVILQLTDVLHKVNLNDLQHLLDEFGIRLIGVSDWQNSLQKELILTANLPIVGKSQQFDEILPEYGYLPPKIIETNIEANQSIYAKNCDLIIHGDVHSGAEVAAEGNIHIYGKLQGRAMAGVNSLIGSIYTQSLEAEFLSVCKRSLYKEKIPTEYLFKAVKITHNKDNLIISPF
ncbi:septum site-determining protein MinC [Conservatibacter flavescens]|uniref:Probable septum site-determining protein MinC n=1 Tax=Conservatibacter flavescens TaxID=28161 RepID=A0A2M8S5F9_9PAST|nr:septum site-determining protein MinC [Conservatibacter flavescens]PJG86364.1 septum site-determining protein MinC [Conservatibacter flavescens]